MNSPAETGRWLRWLASWSPVRPWREGRARLGQAGPGESRPALAAPRGSAALLAAAARTAPGGRWLAAAGGGCPRHGKGDVGGRGGGGREESRPAFRLHGRWTTVMPEGQNHYSLADEPKGTVRAAGRGGAARHQQQQLDSTRQWPAMEAFYFTAARIPSTVSVTQTKIFTRWRRNSSISDFRTNWFAAMRRFPTAAHKASSLQLGAASPELFRAETEAALGGAVAAAGSAISREPGRGAGALARPLPWLSASRFVFLFSASLSVENRVLTGWR